MQHAVQTVPAGESGSPRSASRRGRAPGSGRPCRPYDFRRPEKLSKEQMRLLRGHLGLFARRLSNYLATLSRSSVDVSLLEVDQTTYSETFNGPGPALLCTFSGEQEGTHGLLRIPLRLVFGLVDRLMGGSGEDSMAPRPLTDFENSLMTEICRQMVAFYAETVHTGAGGYRVDGLETDERLMPRVLPADEIMMRCAYQLTIAGKGGRLVLYQPLSALALFGRPAEGGSTGGRLAFLPQALRTLPIPITVELGTCRMSAREVAALRPGSMVRLEQEEARPLRVRVGGICRFAGRPGTLGRRLAVTILGRWKEEWQCQRLIG